MYTFPYAYITITTSGLIFLRTSYFILCSIMVCIYICTYVGYKVMFFFLFIYLNRFINELIGDVRYRSMWYMLEIYVRG